MIHLMQKYITSSNLVKPCPSIWAFGLMYEPNLPLQIQTDA